MSADNSNNPRVKEKTSWSLHCFFLGTYKERGGVGPVQMANVSTVSI